MENKEIYIDGVDVSECSYGEIEKSIFKCSCEYNVRSASMFCKDNPNCYYKQLKRKEQECEELKGQLTILDDEDVVVEITVKQFEEYKKLKAENETYKKMLEDEDVQRALTEIRSGERHLWYNKAEKYKQTLAEIKAILKFYANSKMGEEQPDRTYKIMCSGGFIMAYDPKPARQALQKISEVEDV